MNVWARCRQHGWNRIAFIGAAKHAGKTTALNRVIAEADAAGATLGLCSIGLDGERLDTILGVDKPPVEVPAGTWLASAEKALEQSDAGLTWVEVLPIASPLGSIVIAQTTRPGRVVLAGVRQRRHIELVLPRLVAHGADACLVDGAFDRVAAAAPHLVDAAVLAVGAIAGRTVADVKAHTADFIQRFLLPEVDAALRGPLQSAHDGGQVGVLADGQVLTWDTHQAVFGLTRRPDWPAETSAVYIPGALTDALAEDLQRHRQPMQIVMAHPAQVLAAAAAVRRLYRAGHSVCVWKRLPLAAIAINPHSILGFDLSVQQLQEAIAELAPGVPVFDAMRGGDGADC